MEGLEGAQNGGADRMISGKEAAERFRDHFKEKVKKLHKEPKTEMLRKIFRNNLKSS